MEPEIDNKCSTEASDTDENTQFEEDARVTPLMSATKIWSNLEDTVADKGLFKTINILLVVQSVAVCMEKGQRSSASFALKWLENNHGFPQNVGVKLKRIVTQKETYHPLLVSFSFNRLLETVQSFLDAYLEKDPSDYLVKAATKVVQSSQNMEGFEDVVTQDSALSLTANESPVDKKEKENTMCLRTKRKLLSTKITDVWKPDTCKKPFVSVKRLSETECEQKQKKMFSLQPPELSQRTSENSVDTLKNETKPISRKPREKWTSQLDKYLKEGVRRHGTGKWSRILMDYDFEGRSGTMLKDRWRVLMRAHEVG